MPTPDPTDPPAAPPVRTPADGASDPKAALRALAEATARRAERGNTEAGKSQATDEIGGRGGLDPTRYGDWEVNGLASDF